MVQLKTAIRRSLLGASLAVLTAVVAGCSSPELSDSHPIQSTAPESAPPPPAPPPQAYGAEPPREAPLGDSGLLGGPPEGDAQPAVVASTPVPNPEDLSPEERERIYGPERRHHAARSAPVRHAARRLHGRPAHRAAAGHGLPRHAGAPTHFLPHRLRAVPAPHPSAKAEIHRAPVPAAPAALAPKPALTATPQARLDQLATALRPDITAGAKLTVPAEVAAGKPGVVSLTLPAALFDRITAEAGKLGLARKAKTSDIRAMLGGAGSSVVPNGLQSARLKSGEAATFNWQVTPSSQTPGPLTAEVSIALKGGAKAESVSVGQVTSPSPTASNASPNATDGAPAPAPDNQAAANGASPQAGLAILLGLGLLVLVLVLAMANRVRKERRLTDQRRKARALEEVQAEHNAHARAANGHSESTPETV
jgi:hypothetical protein